MNSDAPKGVDPNMLLGHLVDPGLWNLLSLLPPPGARRILAALFQEMALLAFTDEQRARRDGQILENARLLGLALSPAGGRAFLKRHHQLVYSRRAEELLCLFGDVEALRNWAEETFVIRGLDRAVQLAPEGAVVVSAHLGPMIYYIPMLAYYLSKRGAVPEILAVMNAPAPAWEAAMQAQLDRFTGYHSSKVGYFIKKRGGEDELRNRLDEALSRKAWVLMQLDAISGGRSQKPLHLGTVKLRLPGIWGALRLARRHGVSLLPVITWRTRRDGLAMGVEPPLSPGEQSDSEAAQFLADLLSSWVRRELADWDQLPKIHKLIP